MYQVSKARVGPRNSLRRGHKRTNWRILSHQASILYSKQSVNSMLSRITNYLVCFMPNFLTLVELSVCINYLTTQKNEQMLEWHGKNNRAVWFHLIAPNCYSVTANSIHCSWCHYSCFALCDFCYSSTGFTMLVKTSSQTAISPSRSVWLNVRCWL